MLEPSCIFCQIANGNAVADVIYRDERLTAFHDIHPITPVHVLIIPNMHFESVNDVVDADASLLGHLIVTAREIASREGLLESGYRLVINSGPDAGQTVHHLHLHLLGGARMPFHFGG
jgi:histidine triad (HIT) family protein